MTRVPLDDNRSPYPIELGKVISKTVTFTSTGAGAVGTTRIFTVAGNVLVRTFGVCTTDLTSVGGGTISLGVAGSTAALIGLTAAPDIDKNEIWRSANPNIGAHPFDATNFPQFLVANGLGIEITVASTTVTAGTVEFYCFYWPLSLDSSVAAA